MQPRVAAIMNRPLLLDGALEGHAAVRVAKLHVLRRRLKGATDGVVVGDSDGGRWAALYEQYGQPCTGCDRVLPGRPARRRWFPAYLCYRVLALLCALLVHHLISHVLSYRIAAGWL